MIGFPLGCCEVAEVQGLRPSSAAKADALSRELVSEDVLDLGISSRLLPEAAAAAAAAAGGKGGPGEELFGDPNEPNCMDKKYLVAACLSCSLSSAVCRRHLVRLF